MAVKPQNSAHVSSKTAILAAGGNTLALAMAMEEDQYLSATPHEGYPFGDKLPTGEIKLGDAANFGIFKMNWYMIKQCPVIQPWLRGGFSQSVLFQMGTRINNDPGLATRILIDAWKKWSINIPHKSKNNFWAGHRWGESGIENLPKANWPDILYYYNGIKEIQAACDSDPTVWTSDVRYYLAKDLPNR